MYRLKSDQVESCGERRKIADLTVQGADGAMLGHHQPVITRITWLDEEEITHTKK